MRQVRKLAILAHPEKPRARKAAEEAAELCREMDIEAVGNLKAENLDAVLAFGGDGFFVHTANGLAEANLQIPLAGVDFGKMGFLTRIDPLKVGECLEYLRVGNYFVTERNRLKLECLRNGELFVVGQALNDVYIERTTVRTITFNVAIGNQEPFARRADGGLVATKTGSTAYNRSLGGPILTDERNFVVKIMNSTEIDDKNTFVISSDQMVQFSDCGGGGIARLVYDGKELAILDRADVVRIARSELTTRFIEFSEVDW